MKRVVLIFTLMFSWAFAYNYSGVWINKSESRYNDPIKLKIQNHTVTPFLKRGSQNIRLKAKNATDTGTGLFEAWGFGAKNLVLYIKPINSSKIKVYEKKIDTDRKIVITRSFIFVKQANIIKKLKKRFIGNWRSNSPFSTISKLTIRLIDNNIYVRAWRKTDYGEQPLGIAKAKYYNNALHITWYKNNLIVNATIRGLNYNSSINRYKTLKLDLNVRNANSGLTNRQTIYFKKSHINHEKRYKKHIKVGPVDVNLLINSY